MRADTNEARRLCAALRVAIHIDLQFVASSRLLLPVAEDRVLGAEVLRRVVLSATDWSFIGDLPVWESKK